ncbi:16S rRNA (adenine(1518)-N(6)/adenine(1519)-N(6))-dimethyltransferase RsmA [Thiomicrospira sp. ALE5]|uniref:16S rRNA (adenine(1518)-N(6)/adenine(1519)-N(6))- dimethyltransferase RsmA n=1 Tax=Thiomicrospira sp. ALE5 TaxID=748650 RepID=UPI0008F26477|nr:16S rRNA (adenine(1518)-N(6)/adenine(1519)-N(6))-dimethyltransferase RsmA [Thiomicrospira sp. ALE5]SFR53279.1 16S rRNA (adenine1518-N6/adenine1519-N6)-dimethyltransferase [Thiomicrospira sp. ALE5]
MSRINKLRKASYSSSGHQHKKQFGQNFLNNDSIIRQIISAIHPQPDQHLVEIGPGEAALTNPLVQQVKRLDIIEIDRDLHQPLRDKLGHYPAFALHQADALRFDYTQLVTDNQTLRLVGNLPYNISSPLIFHLLNYLDSIADMHFMLQKEVVERLTATPGNKAFGRLSVMVQYFCEAELLFVVGPEHFDPPPKVDSAIVRLTPRRPLPYQVNNMVDFAALVKQSFAMKRKTLRNNLKGWLDDAGFEQCGIDARLRAEALSVAEFVTLANHYSQNTKSILTKET